MFTIGLRIEYSAAECLLQTYETQDLFEKYKSFFYRHSNGGCLDEIDELKHKIKNLQSQISKSKTVIEENGSHQTFYNSKSTQKQEKLEGTVKECS